MNMKTWLETTGLTTAEEQFNSPPTRPYVTFSDDITAGYLDLSHKQLVHNMSVRLYESAIDTVDEALIEALITSLPETPRYNKQREWDDFEKFFVTIYDFVIEETE